MSKSTILYDVESYRLAEHFLAGEPVPPEALEKAKDALAVVIQTAVEDWFADNPIKETQETKSK